jgi:hypothetical protein
MAFCFVCLLWIMRVGLVFVISCYDGAWRVVLVVWSFFIAKGNKSFQSWTWWT